MEEKIDIELLEKSKETLQEYLRSVTTNSGVCVIQHRAKVKRSDPNALLAQNIIDKFGLTLAEMHFLIVKKNLEDLHIYCEVCGKRAPKLINDKRFCSVKCMHQSEDYQRAIKEGLEAKRREIEEIKKSILANIKKETDDFNFSDMKSRSEELGNYFLSLSKTPGLINISPHRKALVEKNPTAIFVEQMMYKYDLSLDELYFLFKSGFTKSLFCKTCGKRLKNITKDHCSLRCSKLDPEVQAKFESTSMERYGTTNPAKSEEIQEKIKETNLERYGVGHTWQAEEVKAKIRQTWLENYGVTNPNQNPEVRQKIMTTNQERYGVDFTFQAEGIKAKIYDKVSLIRRKKKYPILTEWLKRKNIQMLTPYKEYLTADILKFKCLACGEEFEREYSTYIQYRIICDKCYKDKRSEAEGEIYQYVKDLLPGEEIIKNGRTLLDGLELDMYIPSKRFAIEYDGTYWHSANLRGIDPEYHLKKTELCNRKNVQLIHIFENEWLHKKEIVKSIIASRLGIYERKIFARKCVVKELTDKEYQTFLELNHLQGYAFASRRLGLFFDDELIACMGIGKSRFESEKTELIRFCAKIGVIVIGGLSRLLKHSNATEMISYVDRRYFSGSGYEEAGFKLIGITRPGYIYIKNEQVLSRYACQKHLLSGILGDQYNSELTELENMTNSGYYQVFDCGMLKFKYSDK